MLSYTVFLSVNTPNVQFTILLFLSRPIFMHFAYPTPGLFNNPVPRLTMLCQHLMSLGFRYRFSPLVGDKVFTIEPIAAHQCCLVIYEANSFRSHRCFCLNWKCADRYIFGIHAKSTNAILDTPFPCITRIWFYTICDHLCI